jgi:hypothetical protein
MASTRVGVSAGVKQRATRSKRSKAAAPSNAVEQRDIATNVTPAFPTDLTNDTQLIADLCRFSEGLLEEKYIRRKWKLDNAVWEQMGSDDRFVEKIDDERIRRMRDGSAKREAAQKHVTRAPAVAASIMDNIGANAKHRLEAAKVLDQFAGGGPQGAGTSERFIICDTLHYDKALAITPSSADGATPAAITKDGGDE